jgi:hypothetical protein
MHASDGHAMKPVLGERRGGWHEKLDTDKLVCRPCIVFVIELWARTAGYTTWSLHYRNLCAKRTGATLPYDLTWGGVQHAPSHTCVSACLSKSAQHSSREACRCSANTYHRVCG